MKINKLNFEKFASVTAKQWKQKIQYELQGEDYQKTLVTVNTDNIPQLPFYTQEAIKKKSVVHFPKKTNACLQIAVIGETISNKEALKGISLGFTSVFFTVYDKKIDVVQLLQNITIPIFIYPLFLNVEFCAEIQKKFKNVTILFDPIGKITQTGNWYRNFKHDFDQLNKLLNDSPNSLLINQSLFHDAGASPVQQLAYSLTQLTQYNEHIDLTTCKTVNFIVSTGVDFYLEIAKLKALRVLTESYFSNHNLSIKCVLIQQKSYRNIHLFDQDINSEISSIEQEIGRFSGVNHINSVPKDYYFFEEDFSCIIKNHNQLIRKTNSINKTENITDAFFIEKLTQQLIDKTQTLMNTIQKGGGFTHQLQKGLLHKKIKEKESAEQLAFNKKFTVPRPETIKNPINYPFKKNSTKKKLWQPIVKKRLTAPQEKPIWDNLYSNE
ncbi:methylmalonyl-CoA mutase family protein [Aquimarina agarivorans]|uniref:methylmalonyl-CoA mutase family protein n=1 Tax=Aquimarina agarivorans TaxID=980584 RepID=UPI000248E80A|nr:methylmalonyl-CoA mutase family protein [Aquimarina agarivorans]